jgi:hypothetical protein
VSTTTTRTIEVIVSSAGEATVQTRGFSGPSCRDASRFIERALGERAAERLTPEFHQPQVAAEQAKQRG